MPNAIRVIFALAAGGILLTGRVESAELDPSIWEKEISAFETSDRTNPPPKGAALFVGSSSIRLWKDLAGNFPEWKVINRGFGGSNVPDATYYAERIIFPYEPSKIVLYAGDNDIANGRSAEQVASDFREFVRKVHGELPKTRIYFLAIKPSPSRWHLSPQAREANAKVRRFCRTHRGVEYIDTWTPLLGKDGRPDPALFEKDNLHVNSKGYALWREVIREALRD